MRRLLTAWCVAGTIALAVPVFVAHVEAQPAKDKPAGATAECKDGSYSTAKTKRGACSGHGGIKTWLASATDETKTTAGTGSGKPPATATAPAAAPGSTVAKTTGNAPANATGQCKDGTYTTASSKRGACSGHGGVATWMADAAAVKTPSQPPSTPRSAAPDRTSTPAATPAAPPTAAAPTGSAATQAPPADAPPNATAQCNDGTYSFAKQHRGACSSHKGVKVWFK
jgi:Protein of unknown function (DUF3761)